MNTGERRHGKPARQCRRAKARSATARHRGTRSPPPASPRAPARRRRGSCAAAPAACRPSPLANASARQATSADRMNPSVSNGATSSACSVVTRPSPAMPPPWRPRRCSAVPAPASRETAPAPGRDRAAPLITVRPSRCHCATRSSSTDVVCASTAANGSSSRITAASCNIRRANSARWSSPTDSSPMRRAACRGQPDRGGRGGRTLPQRR